MHACLINWWKSTSRLFTHCDARLLQLVPTSSEVKPIAWKIPLSQAGLYSLTLYHYLIIMHYRRFNMPLGFVTSTVYVNISITRKLMAPGLWLEFSSVPTNAMPITTKAHFIGVDKMLGNKKGNITCWALVWFVVAYDAQPVVTGNSSIVVLRYSIAYTAVYSKY